MFFNIVNSSKRMSTWARVISVAQLLGSKPSSEHVKLLGWLKSHRVYKNFTFLDIDDGSSHKRIQVVIPKSKCPENLRYHTLLSVEGKMVKSSGANQEVELAADKAEVLSPGAPDDYPFTEKCSYQQEDLRLMPHFRSRIRHFASLLRVRSKAKLAVHNFFTKENFINIDTPILTTNNCEGGADVFSVKGQGDMKSWVKDVEMGDSVFGQPVYLSVSGQLHLEALANGISRVYNFNPAFRGEKGSRLHLHEFWMVEMEESFLEGREGYQTLMDRLEALVKFVISSTVDHCPEEVEFLWKFNKKEELKELIPKVISTPFERLKFKEAKKILEENKEKLQHPPNLDRLNRESEVFISKFCGDVPVFITDWPASSKPFYMYTEEGEDGEIALGIDLLLPSLGEVAGGGLREYRKAVLRKKIEDLMPGKTDLDWYLQLRKFGYAHSAGFGLGFERLLQFLLGIDNIRDTIPFPRAQGRCDC